MTAKEKLFTNMILELSYLENNDLLMEGISDEYINERKKVLRDCVAKMLDIETVGPIIQV